MQSQDTPQVDQESLDQDVNEFQPFGVVNVKESKKPKKPQREDDHLWFNQLKYWLAISLVPSFLSAVIAFFYFNFVYLIPLFPLIAFSAWYVRKIFRDKNLDKEEWLK